MGSGAKPARKLSPARHLFEVFESNLGGKVPHGTKECECDASLAVHVTVKLGISKRYAPEVNEAISGIPVRAVHGAYRWCLKEPDANERLGMLINWAHRNWRGKRDRDRGTPGRGVPGRRAS